MNKTENLLRTELGNGLLKDQILARYSTMKIGGPADYFFDAHTVHDIIHCFEIARKLKIPVMLLGGGTNTLIGDRGIRGLVVKNSARQIQIRGMKGTVNSGSSERKVFVEAESGVSMNALVRFTVDEGLGGLEMHLGLPGTVGGAVYMNSKWTHPEGYVGDVVYQATILTPQGDVRVVPQSYFAFAYDLSSIQQSGDVVLQVVFALKSSSKEELWKIADQSMEYRRRSQPQGLASLGCTFQNISKADALILKTPEYTTSAGYLVDKSGLKGVTVGGAQISPLHANFILNTGHATASDVVELIEMARREVHKHFGIKLKEEIIRKGEF